MKYFDIVNEQDEVIGERTAVECHADPKLIHRVVHFTLVDKENKKILISQRSFEVKFDSGKWCFMGEHVLSGETIFPNSAEIVDIKWLSQDELLVGKDTYSEMTQHWVEVVDWKTFLYDSSKPEDAAKELAKKLNLEL